MRRLFVSCLTLLCAPTPSRAQLAITARHVFDGKGSVIPNGAVVVQGDKIVSVGRLPAGFRGPRYDLGDVTLTPGLIDVHSHVYWHFNAKGRFHTGDDGETPVQGMLAAAGNMYATLRSGITTIQSPGSPEDQDLRASVEQGAIPGPRLLTSLGSLSERSGTPEELRQKIRDFQKRGADFIKLFASKSIREGGAKTMTDEQLQAACGEARSLGLRTLVHAHSADAMKSAVLAGCTQIEHGVFATDDVLQLMVEHGTYLSAQCRLVMQNYLDNRARYDGIGNYNAEGFASMEKNLPVAIDGVRRGVKTKGLKMVFGTDAVAGAHGRNVEDLICRVNEAAQTPLAALASATSVAAESMRLGSMIGSLAPGLQADIVAFAGDLTKDITGLRRPIFVMRAGKVYRNDR